MSYLFDVPDGSIQELSAISSQYAKWKQAAPFTLILNKGEIVYQQAGFTAGTENYLFSRIRSLVAVKGK